MPSALDAFDPVSQASTAILAAIPRYWPRVARRHIVLGQDAQVQVRPLPGLIGQSMPHLGQAHRSSGFDAISSLKTPMRNDRLYSSKLSTINTAKT
jgi:hypothetical protein